jgi:signal transduction histidine kinase/ligand-binding sensor domain-containing protein
MMRLSGFPARHYLPQLQKSPYFPTVGKCYYIGCYLLLLLFPALLCGQKSISFQHISAKDGLSQGHVNDLLKDSDGFVWIGTQDGLNRYDGYQFRQFHHHDGDDASLSNNYIWCLLEDSRKNIWAGTFGGGLSRFDRTTETFQPFRPLPPSEATVAENSIRSLCEFPKGTLWAGADRGLWKIDLVTRSFEKFSLPEWNLVTALHPLSGSFLLVGTAEELYRLNAGDGSFSPIRFEGMPISGCTSIARVKDSTFWIGSGHGLFEMRYLPGQDSLLEVRKFTHRPGRANSLPGDLVNNLFPDENHKLWVATNAGLSVLDLSNPVLGFTSYVSDGNNPASLSSDIINCVAGIEPGLLWAGSREGINQFSNLPLPFRRIGFGKNGDWLCANTVLGITEDAHDNLWVATSGGLTRIGQFSRGSANWNIECITPASHPSMPYDYVINVVHAEEGLWAAFRRNGFARLSQNSAGVWHFEPQRQFDDILNGAGMNGILKDSKGITWLASPGQGLLKWDTRNDAIQTFTSSASEPKALKHNYVFCLLEDAQNQLWVGTANGGLCKMNRAGRSFDCFVNDPHDSTSLSSNMVLSIFEDSRQRLWVCTAHGLNLKLENGRFRRFLKKDGLPNEVVYGILEDDDDNLWLSTNQGISKITFTDSVFTAQNFDVSDGLQGNEFNQHAFYKTRNGLLLFGGTNGLTIFDPKNIQPYPHVPPVVLTGFQLFNQSISIKGAANRLDSGEPAGNEFFLKKAINETEEIVLRHDQNFISLEFAALSFTQPENNRYAYKMEGLDPAWVQSGTRRFANYPNLAPGEYTFLVKAANHDGVWNETPKSIQVRVLPPWWQTWWAYLCYAVAMALAAAGFIRQREASVRRIEQAKADERERFRKRTARDFHDEAGNKITKIALLTEVARRQADKKTTLPPLLSQIEENIQELRSGMRDFIWVLDPENDNLYDTILRLKDFANDLFEHSIIRFSSTGLEEGLLQIPLNANQRRHLLLIFKEAMNNCAKYAGATEASLAMELNGGFLRISFSDNGRGFDMSQAAHGNGLRNMRARAEKLGGELEIITKNGKGTTIVLRFAPS